MTNKATLMGVATGTVLGPGSVVSARFQIETLQTLLGQIAVYSARDQRTQRPVSLWAVPPGLFSPEVTSSVRAAIKTASTLSHQNLIASFGSSVDSAGALFVATETFMAGSTDELISRMEKEGQPYDLGAAYQLVNQVIAGLSVMHPVMPHGALCPAIVRLDKQGNVQLAGLGLAAPLLAAHAVPEEYTAPEVRQGQAPTVLSDVYALGALLYQLCTGKSPDPSVPATDLVPSLPAAFDVLIEKCLVDSPDDRFASVTEMKKSLAALAGRRPTTAPPAAFDVPIDVVDLEPEAGTSTASAKSSTRPAGPAPRSAKRSAPGNPSPAPMEARVSQVDLKGLLDEVTVSDAPRWMFVRGGLDYGPLSARELIQAIVKNEVQAEDDVFNMDTGERHKLIEWPQYREFAERTREKRKKDQHLREVKSAIAEESVNTKAKAAVAVAAVLMAGIIGVVYYKTLSPAARQAQRQAELDDALARGQLPLAEGGLQVLDIPRSQQGGGGHGGGHGGGGGGGGGVGSYEAAMNQPVEYNFGSAGGPASATLGDSQVAAPLNAVLGRFGSCATAEIARGGNVRQVQMRIAVAGSGAPMGVTVTTGSPAFKNCVSSIVRGLRWRAFNGPRIGFAWGFSLQ